VFARRAARLLRWRWKKRKKSSKHGERTGVALDQPPRPVLPHFALPFLPSLRGRYRRRCRSAALPLCRSIAGEIKEAAKTKERRGYLTKQIVVSFWGDENFKVSRRGRRAPRKAWYLAKYLAFLPCRLPSPSLALFLPRDVALIVRRFNVIQGSLVPLSFPAAFAVASLLADVVVGANRDRTRGRERDRAIGRKIADRASHERRSRVSSRHSLNVQHGGATARSLVRARARTRIVRAADGGQL